MEVFLLGHLVVDTVSHEGRPRKSLGGTVSFGALAALRHQARPHIVSKIGLDFPDEYLISLSRKGVDISHVRVSRSRPTTKFKLVYEDHERVLYLLARCEDILLGDVPLGEIEGSIAVIGSVIGEVPPNVVQAVSEKAALTVSDIQGYIRRVSRDKKIYLTATPEARAVISVSDIVHGEALEARVLYGDLEPRELAWSLVRDGAGIGVVTMGPQGAYIATSQKGYYVPAAPSGPVVDRTGAGDVFTTVFAIEYQRTGDIREAGAYAAAAASYLIERPGLEGMKSRWELRGRMREVLEKIVEEDMPPRAKE